MTRKLVKGKMKRADKYKHSPVG